MNIDPGDLIVPLEILGALKKVPGKSAYQVWLDQGNSGTEQDFLNSLVGPNGESAYEIWLSQGNTGSEVDFVESLIGPPGQDGESGNDGTDGQSAYQLWLNLGNVGTEEDFINSLKGPIGPVGGAFVQDNFITTEQVLADQFVLLSATPADPLKVSLVIYRGPEQRPGVDFIVEDQTLSWTGLALELLLEASDVFVVRYLPTT